MAIVELALLKKHVNADDFTEDDDYLAHLLETAEASIIGSTRRSVAQLCEMRGGEFPRELKHAILLLAGHWYNQREGVAGVAMSAIPYSIDALVKPFVRLV